MSTSSVIALAVALLGVVLMLVRSVGIVHPRLHLGWLGASLLAIAYLVALLS